MAMAEAERARSELATLSSAGKGAGFGHTADPSAVRAFQETEAKLDQTSGEIRRLQIAAREGQPDASERLAALQGQAKQLRQNLENSKKAVDRLTKEPFWHEASPAYASKEREVRDLMAQVQLAQL